ncbi:hypothetical protein [Saccharicrinis sp. FJH54]|uniref:hypothetical protein n=1 Tax=Saccharicrinis sp. FJH54 TaxID=3344665 RepID=UPI0035D4C2F1
MNPNPSPFILNWNQEPDLLHVSAYNNSTSSVDVKLSVELQNSFQEKVAITDMESAESVSLFPGYNELSVMQVLPVDQLMFSDAYMQVQNRLHVLPEDNYRLCISVVDADGTPISETPFCSDFYISGIGSTYLIYPNNAMLFEPDELANTVFQWTPSFLDPSRGYFDYQLIIVEVLENQSPAEAIYVNDPIIEECYPGNTTQFLWPEDMISLIPGLYAWSVRIVEYCGQYILSDYSEISTFTVGHTITRERRDSTRTRPGDEGDDPRDAPPPTVYGEELDNHCSQVDTVVTEGTPISLGMILKDNSKFNYPRAVPLRAEGIDYDLVKFKCFGCSSEDTSVTNYVVRDNVQKFQWQIVSGPGTLNKPPKVEKIDSIQQKINDLQNKLNGINDSLKQIHTDTTVTIPDRIEELKNKIKESERILKEKDSLLVVKNKRLDSLNLVMKLAIQKINRFQHKIDSVNAVIEENLGKTDSLENVLKGEPTAEEKTQQAVVAGILEEKERKMQELAAKDQQILDESERLGKILAEAWDELKKYRDAYNILNIEIEAVSGNIVNLETLMMRDKDTREFMKRQKDWRQKAIQFIWQYYGSANKDKYYDQQKEAEVEARLALVGSDANDRKQHFNAFSDQLNRFNNKLTGFCKNDNQACQNALSIVLSSGERFKSTVDGLSQTNYLFDLKTQRTIDSLRSYLEILEVNLVPVKRQMDQAQKAYQEALSAYNSAMEALQKEKNTLLDELAEINERLLKAEEKLNKLIEKRINDLERNREEYLNRLHKLRLENTGGYEKLEAFADSLNRYMNDTTRYRIEIELLSKEIKQLEEQITAIKKAIERFNQLLEEAEKKTEKLRGRARSLRRDSTDIQHEIDSLNDELNKLKNPPDGKNAEGLHVYYIPPPLEEILKNPSKFEERKDSVKAAEAALDKAYAQKAAVQGKLVNLMDQVSKDLIKYKDVSDLIPGLEDEIKKLDDDIKTEKTKKAQDYLDEQQKVQDKITHKTANVDSLKKVIDGLIQDSTKVADEIKEVKDKIEKEDSLLTAKRNALLEKMTELENEEKILRNAQNTLTTRQNELAEERIRLDGLQEDLARARNDLTRANAKDDESDVNETKKKIDQLNADIKLSKDTKIPAQEQKISSASSSLGSAQRRVNTVKEQKDAAWKEWNDVAKNLDGTLRDSLNAKNERLEKILSSIERQRKLKKNSEKELEKAKEEREKKQGEVNDKINNEEDIKSKAKSLDELTSKLKDAKDEKTKLSNAIQEALNLKDKLIKESKEALKQAKERLDKNKKDLQDYLKGEFDSVDFEVKLKLTANDEVSDDWRKNDKEPAILFKTLKYPLDRTPILVGGNTEASDEKPDDKDFKASCVATLLFDKDESPKKKDIFQIDKAEPRTIALMYKDGEPLWKEWPVIPDDAPLLSRDVVRMIAKFENDFDLIQYGCETEDNCDVFPPEGPEKIRDLGTYSWAAKEVHSSHRYFTEMFWETPDVEKPKDKENFDLIIAYNPSEVETDDVVSNKKITEVRPGIMIEVTKELTGVPDTSLEVKARVVKGNHKGLNDEEIEFKAVLKKGASENYGFEGGNTSTTVTTDPEGYAKTQFNFGNGFAEFEIEVTWKRGGQTEKCIAKAPISIAIQRFSSSVPEFAWEATKKLFKDGGSADDAIKEFPEKTGDEGEKAYAAPVHGIAGLQDAEKDFVNDKNVEFSVSLANIKVEPEQDKTELYGIARTTIKELPEDTSVTLTAEVEDKYKDVGDPAKDDKDYSTKKSQKFKIGSASSLFVIAMDEPFNPNEPVNGSGKLEVDIGQGNVDILSALKEVRLTATDVELQGSDDDFTAVAGKVSWGASGNPIKRRILGFDFSIDSLVITATSGAGLGGDVKKDSLIKNPVKFYAEAEPSGDFMGTISNIPSFEVKGFKLKEGSSFTLDWHSNKSPGTFAKTFKGVVIHTASLELPEQFSKGEDKSTLSVSEFYIGTDLAKGGNTAMGFGGEISYEGTLLKTGFAGYDLTANKFVLGFDHSSLVKAEINGELALPIPMEGKIETSIGWAEDKFAATLATENPVAIPRLGVTMTLKNGCGLSWDTKKKVGSLRLNAFMVSQKFGEVDLSGFEINSEGLIKADEITIEKAIKFGSGFDLYVEKLGFKLAKKEYSFMFGGGFSFPRIGIDQLKGSVELAPGPTVSVNFEEAKIHFDKGPVSFDGEFHYSASEFKGDFTIGIKKVIENGIEGMIVVGNTKDDKDIDYSYWYTQLTIGTKIQVPQYGFSVLKLGGGLGYNYNPPIGEQEGSPSHNDGFSFKAIMGLGNIPGGEVFNSNLEMVLVPGKFSLYGKVWLLSQEDALYGDGQMNLMWDPRVQVDGYSRMFIGIPNAEGKILLFNGKINFLFAANDPHIWSDKLEGSVLQVIKAEGLIDVTKEHFKLKGELGYEFNKTIDLAVVSAIVDLAVKANMDVLYVVDTKSLDASAEFHGHWNVDLDTPMGTADIISGRVDLGLSLKANPSFLEVKGNAGFSYDVWVYDGDVDVDVTYRVNL